MFKQAKISALLISVWGLSTPALAQNTLNDIVINIDENTKTNTRIGEINFTAGQADTTVQIEVGISPLNNWVTNGEAFEPIPFTSNFSSAPVLLSHLQSDGDYRVTYDVSNYSYTGSVSEQGYNFITRPRHQNVTATGFEAVIESELDKRGTSTVESITETGSETLGWIAISEPTQGIWGDIPFEALTTGFNVTHSEYTQSFAAPFTDAPTVMTTITSHSENSQAGVGINSIGSGNIKMLIDDLDDDSHIAEEVNVMSFQGSGILFANNSEIAGETGVISVNDTSRDEAFTVSLLRQFNEPVVFLQAVSGDKPIYDAAMRLTDVSSTSFSAYLHSETESVTPEVFGEFELHYQVFEAGKWEIPLEHYQYSIVSGNETGAFSVDSNTGKIRVADQTQLDFESGNNTFNFTVRVTDGLGNVYDTAVTVNVHDIQDSLNTDAQTIAGLASDDWSGFGLAPAGDVNGDGYDDIIVGVPQDDTNGEDAGRAYVLFSNATGYLPNFSDVLAGTGGFVINGAQAGDNAGFSVNGGADINGDGLSDIVVGAPFASNNGLKSGSVYVVFGKSDTGVVELNTLNQGGSQQGYAIHGAYKHDYVGGSVLVGDVNGDGLADVIAGETQTRFVVGQEAFTISGLADDSNYDDPHMAYVVYGKTNNDPQYLSEVALDTNASGFVIKDDGRAPFKDWPFGALVMPSGDFNSDGLTDVIVSHGILGRESGVNKLLFGRVGGTAINYGSISSNKQGININAEYAGNYALASNLSDITVVPGFVSASIGDINADGIDDMALLAPDDSCCSSWDHPRAYIIFGTLANVDIDLTAIKNGNGGFVIHNDASNVSFKSLEIVVGSIGGAGDLNGDGYDDIIIGDPFAEDKKGRVYTVYGSDQTDAVYLSQIIDTERGFYSTGNGGEMLGQWIASAGDINGDGIKDIQFGTPSSDKNNLTNNGAIYVLKGDGRAVSSWGSDGDDNFSGSVSPQFYATGLGNDTVAGNGGADAIYTGPGDDTITISDGDFIRIDGGGGTDTLKLNGAGINLNLMEGSAKVRSVEVFDIRGTGANILSLNKSVSSNSRLRILGDADDSVYAANNQWQDTGNVVVINSVEYSIFEVGVAQMLVQTGVATEINNDPSIENHSFAVSEYTAGGSQIGQVTGDANDVGDYVTYEIIGGNGDRAFVINATTGVLSINESRSRLDYEEQSSYALTVQVTDSYGAAATATVTVNVNDVEFVTHNFSADLSATESTFGSTAFTDILHVATMNEIASPEFNTGHVPEIPSLPDEALPPGFSELNPTDWRKHIDNMTAGMDGVFDMNLGGDFFFEPRFSMQTGQVVSDIPVSMDLAYADEIQVGQETLITAQVNLDNYAGFSATSPAFDIDFVLGVKDLFFSVKSDIIPDNNGNPLDKSTSLDEGSFTVNVKSDEIAVQGRHCINTIGQPACAISAESDAEQPLRISASIDAPDWFEQELYYKTSWKAWYYGASGQAISHNKRECREDFFYPAGEDLYFDYNFEMLDTFLSVHADIKQEFYLEVRPISKLTLEDGTVLVFKGDRDIAFTPELHHDVNNDGIIDANLTVNLYSVFYNDTKTSVGARLPFKLGLAEWNVQEAVCTADNIYLYQQHGLMYEKGQYGPGLDFEVGFEIEEMSLTEWKWDEAAETLASPFVKKSESVEPLPAYLYNDNEWLLAHEKISKDISFDLCNQDGECGQPVPSYNNNAPTASNVTVSGDHTAKRTVTASYTYSDVEGDTETDSSYQWFVSSDSAGSDEVAIDGETFLSYTLRVEDVDKFVRFCVRPNDGKNSGFINCSGFEQVATSYYKDGSIVTGFGQALVLNGVDQSIKLDNYGAFDSSLTSFTFETWINVNAYPASGSSNVLTLKADGSSQAALRVMPEGILRVKATENAFLTTETVDLDTWHHIAITYDQNTQQVNAYLDGELVISATDASSLAASDFILGANNSRSSRFLDGKLDEFRVWTKAKSQEEIQQGMYAGVSTSDADLFTYLDFEGADASNIVDRASGSYLDAQNSVTFEKHRSFAVFDGIDDYLEVSHDTDLSLDKQNFTVQAWVYVTGETDTKRAVVGKMNSGSSRGWSLRLDNSNRLNFRYSAKPLSSMQTNKNQVFDFSSTEVLNMHEWYHIAATVDRDALIAKIYLNGVEVNSKNLNKAEIINNTHPMRIGAYSGDGFGGEFKGYIDDVVIWKRTLTQEEIQACMQDMKTGCEYNMMALYDFNNESAKNKDSNQYHGAAVNGAYLEDSFIVSFIARNGETLYGSIPAGNHASFELTDSPNNGQIYFNEYTGEFAYTPNVGNTNTSDSFSYIVYDINDGYSFERTVTIVIE